MPPMQDTHALGQTPVDDVGELKRRVADVVTRFEQDVMAIRPGSVSVDLHPHAAVVTMRGAASRAERDYARDRPAKELLERFHAETFNAVKGELEALVGRVLGRKVRRSRLNLDPESGDGVILITFADRPGQEMDELKEGRSNA